MPAKSKAQQRFMGMVHAAQKGELDNPSAEVEKAADSMSDADAKDYASTKHKGLPNHVRKENMEKELKEIIRQTYRESLRESINEAKYPTNLYVNSVIYGQGFTGLKGIEGGKYYKVVEMDDYSATLVPCDEKGKIKGSKKVRHKLSSLEGGIATAKRGDENGIVIESVISEDIKSDINKFLDKLNKQFPEQEYTTDFKGGKYARIVQQNRKYSGNRSAWGFVAMEDNPSKGFKKGDLLKAAGFNTPANGARGNILDGTAKYDKYSPMYLRESVNETVSHEAMGIASMTNTRKEAVQKFIDDNNLNAKEILNHVTKGKLPERIRFVQALVGTPNNSSFKWYVKTYANEGVNESIDINHWKKYANGGGPLFSRKITTQSEFNTEFREVAYGYNNDPDSRENKLKRDKIEKVKKLAQEFFDKEGFITSNIIDEMWSAMVSGKIKEGKVNEGKKVFKINPGIGSSKYSISSHDGVKKHKDGSDFYDIEIFKNKVDLEKGIKKYSSNGFVKESVNESDAPSDIIKDLDKLRNDLIKKVEVLIAKKKKLYSNVDITTPMSADEKQLDKDIQSIFSEIQSIIQQKRKINK